MIAPEDSITWLKATRKRQRTEGNAPKPHPEHLTRAATGKLIVMPWCKLVVCCPAPFKVAHCEALPKGQPQHFLTKELF